MMEWKDCPTCGLKVTESINPEGVGSESHDPCLMSMRQALEFYAEPSCLVPGARWSDGYPGGITYQQGGGVVLDMGQIAESTLTAHPLREDEEAFLREAGASVARERDTLAAALEKIRDSERASTNSLRKIAESALPTPQEDE